MFPILTFLLSPIALLSPSFILHLSLPLPLPLHLSSYATSCNPSFKPLFSNLRPFITIFFLLSSILYFYNSLFPIPLSNSSLFLLCFYSLRFSVLILFFRFSLISSYFLLSLLSAAIFRLISVFIFSFPYPPDIFIYLYYPYHDCVNLFQFFLFHRISNLSSVFLFPLILLIILGETVSFR